MADNNQTELPMANPANGTRPDPETRQLASKRPMPSEFNVPDYSGYKGGLVPDSMEQAMTLAQILAKSNFIPNAYHNKPGDVLAGIMMGAEIGLKPLQALQNIAVINGRPSVWGDALPALILAFPDTEYFFAEEYDEQTQSVTARGKRKGRPEVSRTFSMHDAAQAGLSKKQGPWQNYPKRMCQYRAQGYLARDLFSDVLKGLALAEESQDIPLAAKDLPEPSANRVRGQIRDALNRAKTLNEVDGAIRHIKEQHESGLLNEEDYLFAVDFAADRRESVNPENWTDENVIRPGTVLPLTHEYWKLSSLERENRIPHGFGVKQNADGQFEVVRIGND